MDISLYNGTHRHLHLGHIKYIIQFHTYIFDCILVSYCLHIGILLVKFVLCSYKTPTNLHNSIVQMCGGGMCSILLLPLVARCLETIDVCIWRMFVFMSVVVTVWGLWACLLCSGRSKKLCFYSLGVFKYVVCLCSACDGCCVFCLYCEALSCRCSCMGSVSVSSCICCMCVSCVHPVAVLNDAFCMTLSLLMLVEDAIGHHTEEAYSRTGLITAL